MSIGSTKRRAAHPSVFFLMMLPFGMTSGYVSNVLGHLARQAGMNMSDISALVAATTFVHMFKFIWAPLVDTTLTRKAWYWIGNGTMALGYIAMSLTPVRADTALVLTLMITASSIGSTVLGMALESIMAYDVAGEAKGRASGWFQAGNLGGAYLAGYAGLALTRHLGTPWITGAILGVGSLACGLMLRRFDDVPAHRAGATLCETWRAVGRDLAELLRSAKGVVGMVMFLVPIGTGAAQGLFTAMASDWRASMATVEQVNGLIGGFVVILGCLAGGWLSDRMPRASAYLLSSLVLVAFTAAMGFFPHTPSGYVVWVLAYTFGTGLTYGTYGGFVLDAAGVGAVATKYNVLASFANAPIWYMTRLDGWAYDRWDAKGMLYFEAALGVAGCVVVAGLLLVMRRTSGPRAADARA